MLWEANSQENRTNKKKKIEHIANEEVIYNRLNREIYNYSDLVNDN